MRKNRLAYLLKKLSLTLDEFAAESGIGIKTLKKYEKQPDAGTTRAILLYIRDQDTPQLKRIIRDTLLEEGGKLYLNDSNFYPALGDYLSYAAPLSKYAYPHGLPLMRRELYDARSMIFFGEEQAVCAVNEFCREAAALKAGCRAIALYNRAVLEQHGLYREVLALLSKAETAVEIFEAKSPVSACGQNSPLLCSLPNHILLEVLEKDGVKSVLSYDAVRANSEYRRIRERKEEEKIQEKQFFYYRIAYVFDAMQVRNDELAERMYLDKTLVSKWRNGKRKLRCYDDTLHRLVQELYHSGSENQIFIQRLLDAYGGPERPREQEAEIAQFCSWLTYREEEREEPIPALAGSPSMINYQSYIGLSGVYDAVKALLHYCKQSNAPLTLYVACFDHLEYLYCLDGILLDFLQEYRQHKAHLKLRRDFSVGRLNDYLQGKTRNGRRGDVLLGLLLQGAITVQFCDTPPPQERKAVIAVPELAALEITRERGVPDEVYARGYYSGFWMRELCQAATRPPGLEENLIKRGTTPCRDAETLIVSDIGIFGFLEKEELTRFFQLTARQADIVWDKYRPIFLCRERRVRCLLDIGKLQKALSGMPFEYGPLSAILGRKVTVSPAMIQYYLKKAIRLLTETQEYEFRLSFGETTGLTGCCILERDRLTLWNQSDIRVFRNGPLIQVYAALLKEQLSGLPSSIKSPKNSLYLLSRLLFQSEAK